MAGVTHGGGVVPGGGGTPSVLLVSVPLGNAACMICRVGEGVGVNGRVGVRAAWVTETQCERGERKRYTHTDTQTHTHTHMCRALRARISERQLEPHGLSASGSICKVL